MKWSSTSTSCLTRTDEDFLAFQLEPIVNLDFHSNCAHITYIDNFQNVHPSICADDNPQHSVLTTNSHANKNHHGQAHATTFRTIHSTENSETTASPMCQIFSPFGPSPNACDARRDVCVSVSPKDANWPLVSSSVRFWRSTSSLMSVVIPRSVRILEWSSSNRWSFWAS